MFRKGLLAAPVLLIVLLSFPLSAQERRLHWQSIMVTANLDEKGTLTIEERQSYVFFGEWNGGERRFNILPGEKFKLISLKKLDPVAGAYKDLAAGDLDLVDHYDWADSETLRWRSRLQSDTPFNNTVINYSIKYSYENVLRKTGDTFTLDFDFLFPDRDGIVMTYFLTLRLHESWASARGSLINEIDMNVEPGKGHPLKLDLKYTGAVQPAAKTPLTGWMKAAGLLCAFLIFFYYLQRSMKADETRGLFKNIPELADPDESCLRERLFYLLPEEVGAMWDVTIGAPEVAAIIARLVSEKKLLSELVPNPDAFLFFNRQMMQLKLLVPREAFSDYEKKLINSLFVNNRTTTNTHVIKEYYKKKKKPFDPRTEIMPGLGLKIKKYSNFRDEKIKAKEYLPSLFFLILFALSVTYSGIRWGMPYNESIIIMSLLILFLGFFPGLIATAIAANSLINKSKKTALVMFLGGGPAFFIMLCGIGAMDELYLFQFISMASLALCFSILSTVLARTNNSPDKLAFRRELAAIRNYFQKELSKEKPRLKDEWFPYLVAFGLTKMLDRWDAKYGSESSFSSASSRPGPTTSSGTNSWTGGGGLYGGAGATGAWIAATGAMAAAGSSSSSGGGGGGSSGGGGGGGW